MKHQQQEKSNRAARRAKRSSEEPLAPRNHSEPPLLRLQRSLGNQAVLRLLNVGGIQPKLRISDPNDESEQEADRVADEVMRMPDPAIQSTPG
jgi:hypothetical protein